MSQKPNRFSCLKPTEDNSTVNNRTNRFQGPSKVINSRWQRSKSPEKRNAFTKPQRNDRGFSKDNPSNGRYDKGGFGKYRYKYFKGLQEGKKKI